MSDNAAIKARERQRQAQEALDAKDSDDDDIMTTTRKGKKVTNGGGGPFQLIAVILGIGVYVIAILAILMATGLFHSALIVTGVSGPNGTIIIYQGPPGNDGKRGPPGRDAVCTPCTDGRDGMCLANPACGVGPQGPQGPEGPTPICNCSRGLTGADGNEGPQGPRGFNGTNGINGINGTNGTNGANGTCDCYNLPVVNVTDLNVNGTTTFNGPIQCPGGAMALNCFGTAVCPDLSTCGTKVNSLQIRDSACATASPTNPALYIGCLADLARNALTDVYMGTDIAAPITDWILRNIHFYAQHIHISSPDLNLRSRSGTLAITALNAAQISMTSANGNIEIESAAGIASLAGGNGAIIANSGGNMQLSNDNAAGTFSMVSQNTMSQKATTFVFNDNTAPTALPWFSLTAPNTFDATTGAPTPGTAFKLGSTRDLIMDQSRFCMVDTPDGYWKVGPNVEIVKGGLRSATGTLHFRSVIDNDSGTDAVTITDTQGLYNTLGEFRTNTMRPYSGTTITLNGDLNVTGSVNSLTGTCCTSDSRVKQNITRLNPWESAKRILSLEPLEYKFKETYQKVDSYVRDHMHRGFMAQSVASIIPRAVTTIAKTVGDIHYPDFHLMRKEELIPDLVAAYKHLHSEHEKLLSTVVKLTASLENVLKLTHLK